MKIRKNEKIKKHQKKQKKLNLGHKVAPRPSGVLLVIEIALIVIANCTIASGEWWVARWRLESGKNVDRVGAIVGG